MDTRLLFLCTGNAARSVMAGAIWTARFPDAPVITAGTHVVEGLPMSHRTRDALLTVGVPIPHHRSRQVDDAALDDAELVIVMEAAHIRWLRKIHPKASAHSGTLRHLALALPTTSGTLADRIAALDLASVPVDDADDVIDPAGGDLDVFIACAREIVGLIDDLAVTLGASTGR